MRQLLPIASARRTWAVLGAELRAMPGATTAALLTAVGATLCLLVGPWVLGQLVDDVVAGEPSSAVWRAVVLIAASSVIGGVLTAVSARLIAGVGETVLATLRERVVDRSLRLPQQVVEAAGSGDLLSRVSDDVAKVTEAINATAPQAVRSLLAVVFTMVGLLALDWRLGLAGMSALPVYLLALRWYLPRSSSFYARERVAMAERSHVLVGSLQGHRTVRAYGLEEEHLGTITDRSAQAMTMSLDVYRFVLKFGSWMNRAEYVGLAAIIAAGFWLVRDGAGTVGAVTAAALLFHRLFGPLGLLMMTADEIQSAGASLARLVGVADLDVARPTSGTASDAAPVQRRGGLSVRGVSHRYGDGGLVLDDVSLDVAPGERVALVGASGAGKTTLASIMAGLLAPTTGTVSIGGRPIDDPGAADPRDDVAMVSQEVHVFSGALVDDVRLAAPSARDEEVAAALAVVGATGWVGVLTDGLSTVVGEGGHQLSAAQAQQVALARLVLADPAVAVLDEATAEAGSAGARDLEQAAAAATAGRTTVVVAHRLTQASAADRVVVLDAGRVVEIGSHDELVARGGRYAALWAAWNG